MSLEESALTHRAEELRRAFDRSFARAPNGDVEPTEAFLAISTASDAYALRLAEISGLYVDKKVTRLPSASADLIGLASFRGALVPIYDLPVLLGHSAATMPRWLVLVASRTPVGLAFDRFDGYLDLSSGAIVKASHADMSSSYTNEIARVADSVRKIIHLPSILETITNRASQRARQKE